MRSIRTRLSSYTLHVHLCPDVFDPSAGSRPSTCAREVGPKREDGNVMLEYLCDRASERELGVWTGIADRSAHKRDALSRSTRLSLARSPGRTRPPETLPGATVSRPWIAPRGAVRCSGAGRGWEGRIPPPGGALAPRVAVESRLLGASRTRASSSGSDKPASLQCPGDNGPCQEFLKICTRGVRRRAPCRRQSSA